MDSQRWRRGSDCSGCRDFPIVIRFIIERHRCCRLIEVENDQQFNNRPRARGNYPGKDMANWKSNIIDAYRWTTMPVRQLNLRRMRKNGTVPVIVLFYHRVENEHPNPWTISEQDFVDQIAWMQKHFDLVDLQECQKRIRSGRNTRPTVSITFDDGYADNCNFALPMLIERRIPVTYFVTTCHVTQGQPFEHDVDRDQPLTPNSIDSLRAIAQAGVEIGGHSRSHADLATISDPDTLYDEVIASTREMESLIGKSIRFFAFPFGQKQNLNPRVFELLEQHGFAGVCSAYGGLNEVGGDAFHLQRIHGDPMLSRFKNWLSGDPRQRKVQKYDWLQELKNSASQ